MANRVVVTICGEDYTFVAEESPSYMQKVGAYVGDKMDEVLNKKSGMLGISGVSSDDRDVTAASREGNPRAKLAQDILEYQIAKYIGGYMVALGGCNAIVFTAGLGENQAAHRAVVGEYLSFLGVKIDPQLNKATVLGKEGKISAPDSSIEVFVIPTNEELVIARDTKELVEKLS